MKIHWQEMIFNFIIIALTVFQSFYILEKKTEFFEWLKIEPGGFYFILSPYNHKANPSWILWQPFYMFGNKVKHKKNFLAKCEMFWTSGLNFCFVQAPEKLRLFNLFWQKCFAKSHQQLTRNWKVNIYKRKK